MTNQSHTADLRKSLISTTFEPATVKSESALKVQSHQVKELQKGRNIDGCIGNFPW
jgi:hypothetical protein